MLFDVRQNAVLLQNLTAYIQRQIFRVDNTAYKSQIWRQQLFVIIGNEDTLDIKLDPRLVVGTVKIHRCGSWNVKECRKLRCPLDLVVNVGQRLFTVVRDGLVELNVVLFGQLTLWQCPQCRCSIDLLAFPYLLLFFVIPFTLELNIFIIEHDWVGNVIGVFFDHFFHTPLVKEFFFILFEFDVNDRSVFFFGNRRYFIFSGTVCRKFVRLFLTCFFCNDINMICHHKYRIETDTELTDEITVFFRISGHLLHKGLGSGLGDGSEILHQILFIHTDTVVTDGQRVVIFVNLDIDLARPFFFFEFVIYQMQIVEFVDCITCIGDKLS